MLLSLNDFDTIIILRNDDEQCALEIEADSPVEMLAVLVPLEQLAQQAAEERDLDCVRETLSLRDRILDRLKFIVTSNSDRYRN